MIPAARQTKVKPSFGTRALPGLTADGLAASSWVHWLLVAAIAIPAGLFYWTHSDPQGAGRYWDFENGYYATARAVLAGGAAALRPHLADGSFVNIPVVAWLLTPLGLLGKTAADAVFAAISVASILVSLLLLSRYGTALTAPRLCLLFILNGPLWYGLLFGNTTPFVLLCLAAALTLWKRRHGYAAGLLLGAAAVIKPMIILFGVYFVFRKAWGVVLGGATVIIGSLLGSIAVAGLETTVYWYHHSIVPFSGKPMPAYNLQSVESFILRLATGPEEVTNIEPHLLPAWGKLLRDLVFAALFAIAGYGLWRGRARSRSNAGSRLAPQDYSEFCIVLTLSIMVSTVSWTHYYLLLLLPYSLYFMDRLALKADWLTRILIWTSIVFCSLPVRQDVFASKWLEAIFYKTFQSHWLIGALLLFWALMRGVLESQPQQRIGHEGAFNA